MQRNEHVKSLEEKLTLVYQYYAPSILLWVLLVGCWRSSTIVKPYLYGSFHLLASQILLGTDNVRGVHVAAILQG